MTRQELLVELRRHDWYHMYSDDHRVWSVGHRDATRLREELSKLGCPFRFWDIHKAICNNDVADYVEVNPGEFRKPEWSKVIASQTREDLLTSDQIALIMNWFA